MSETSIHCDRRELDSLFPRTRMFLRNNIVDYNLLGDRVHGYRTPDAPSIWIRDFSDMIRGFKYWERDMKSTIDHFAQMQSAKGWIFDYFTMSPEKVPCERENWAKYVRVPVEADVEYRFIKAVHQAWQATGDDGWLRSLLPAMERALGYVLTDASRWDEATQLIKRAYTIDTWDFDYTAGGHPWLNFQMGEHTFWGIMHGDNSGYYEAFRLMAAFYRHLGSPVRARRWMKSAAALRERANKLCFNGRFYTHHVHLVPVAISGVNEDEQLSLSNPMAINRGLTDHRMAVSILEEYRRRAGEGKAFAEWFSLDPPMPDGIFGDRKLVGGAYCNGGIMPLVGGELAKAALEHGFEDYGVRQLLHYEQLTSNNESYLWYFPDGRPATIDTSTSPDASPSDAWGSSAMLYALAEGLAGVQDTHKLYRRVRLCPRWPAAASGEARVRLVYGASGAFFAYSYRHEESDNLIELDLEGEAVVDLHLLLPGSGRAGRVEVDGRPVRFFNSTVEGSGYVDSRFGVKGSATLRVGYRRGLSRGPAAAREESR